MPKKGFRSLTFKNSTMDEIQLWYDQRIYNLSAFGINSVSGLCTTILMSALNKDGEHLTKIMAFISKSKFHIHCEFTIHCKSNIIHYS